MILPRRLKRARGDGVPSQTDQSPPKKAFAQRHVEQKAFAQWHVEQKAFPDPPPTR